jgi:cysteinyl-tRNA synthetase
MVKTFGVDITEDVKIDKLHLEVENETYPAKYQFYSDALAGAKTELDFAKDNLEATEARRDLYWRRNPPDDLKATEKVFDSLLADDTEVRTAKDAVRAAQETVNTLYSAVNSLDKVGSSIDNLVKLALAKYYQTTGDVKDTVGESKFGH